MSMSSTESHCRFCEFGSHCVGALVDQHGQAPEGMAVAFGRRLLRKEQRLNWAGDRLENVYFVRDGALKTIRTDSAIDGQITGFVYAGEPVCTDATLDGVARADTVAVQAATLCSMPLRQFLSVCDRSPPILLAVRAQKKREIMRLEARLSTSGAAAEHRIAAFVLDFSARQPTRARQIGFTLPMAHRDIGNYLGLAPETISRALARMQKRNLLSIRGHVLSIKSLEGLRHLAAFPGNRWMKDADAESVAAESV